MAEAFTVSNENCVEANPPQCADNPRFETPGLDPSLHPLENPACSLVDSLGSLVDDIRQISTDLGLRPYRLFSIITRWTGGQIGRGTQVIDSELEMLPTPAVSVAPLQGEMTSGGLTERGTMRVTEISPRYTEDDVQNLFHVQPLPQGHEGFIEMRMDGRDGVTRRRRFIVIGAPDRQADKFQWVARMVEQNASRSTKGVLSSRQGMVP